MGRNIVFTTRFDLCADRNGLRELPSGTTPHNPSETRFVRRNAELAGKNGVDADLSKRVAELAEAQEKDRLLTLLWDELRPVGRAAESRWV